MKWIKKGLIYCPPGDKEWSRSHATVPLADFLEQENRIRIYFTTRNADNIGLPGMIEVDADDPSSVLHVAEEPLLQVGELGTFDDYGVMPSWIVNHGKEKRLYYQGWNVRNTIPYHNSIGLAVSHDGGRSFKRYSKGPVLDRNLEEPYFAGTPCVLHDDDGTWRNYYLSCTDWRMIDGVPEARYHIKYAESRDGIKWERNGVVAIDFKNEKEAGLVRPSVLKDNGRYRMWFAYRNFENFRTDIKNSYRIGYAESEDGVAWTRMDDKAGIDIGPEGWDSIMVTYPHVIEVKGKKLMFYNGNGFGRSGIGYAVLSDEAS